jgi:Xaa-Pro aminopeptidase
MGVFTPFDKAEFQARVDRLQNLMRARGVDALIVDAAESMAYYCGYSVSLNMYRALVVPAAGEPVMLLREIDEAPYEELTWLSEHVTFLDWNDPVEIVAAFLKKKGYGEGTIGVDFQSFALTVARYDQYKSLLPKVRFVDMSEELLQAPLVKSEAEITYLRKAAGIVDTVMAETIAWAKVGVSERDAQEFASAAYFRHGSDHMTVGPVTVGEGENFLHGNAHTRPLKQGEILHLELLPKYRGYAARLMRGTVLGKPTAEQSKIALKLIELQDRQFAAIRPGAVGRDIDAIGRQGAIDAGIRKTYPFVTGYTLGNYPASTPRGSNFYRAFLPNADWKFEAGMVFHAYVSAQGIAFSETILVTKDGCERLTKLERKLFSK